MGGFMKEIIEQYGFTIYAGIGYGWMMVLLLAIIYGPFRMFVLEVL
jgi:hypothetical protein